MNNGLLNLADLLEWTGYKQRSNLVDWLDEPPTIPYKPTPGGNICTTEGAVTAALLAGKQLPEHGEAWEAQ